jgi:hypothetical protein
MSLSFVNKMFSVTDRSNFAALFLRRSGLKDIVFDGDDNKSRT